MPSPGLWPAPTTMATRSFRRMSLHSRDWVLLQYLFVTGLVVSCMNEAPDDRAQRAHPKNGGSGGLNRKASPAFIGGLRITGHVKDAAGDPDQAKRCRDCIADVDRKQPERGQENRHPFQRVHLHAKHPLEVGIA